MAKSMKIADYINIHKTGPSEKVLDVMDSSMDKETIKKMKVDHPYYRAMPR